MPELNVISSLLWAAAVGIMVWYVGRAATQITYVTLADGRREARQIPLLFRLLLPWTENATWVKGKRYDNLRETVKRKLISSGYEGLITPNEFLALKWMMPLVLGPILIGLLWLVFRVIPPLPSEAVEGGAGNMLRDRQLIIFLALLLLLYIYPASWLKGAVKARHLSIERALPFVLDLLTLSVEAGLDFISGIRRIVQKRKIDPLGEELIRTFQEMQVGKTRKEALRDFAYRVDHPDISAVVNALVQADELGVSIGTILRIQSDQIRTRRFLRAEEMANKAPVKLLFPLVCFIFPAVFLVLLGPIFLQMFSDGGF